MKTIEIKVYQFSELSEAAKQKAVENLSDINVDHDWWESTYEDAERAGIKITEFDLDRNRHCKGEFIDESEDVADKIIAEHGKDCETHKTAVKYLTEIYYIEKRDVELPEEKEENIAKINDEFLQSILEDYSIMLQNEYEYLTSEAAIIETIEANEYDFTEDGKIY